jgi:hypothetical protein
MLRRTPRTDHRRARLRRIIAEVRSAGVVVTQGEHTVGAGAVAAPIIERDGRVRHAIGIGVPIDRLGPRREASPGWWPRLRARSRGRWAGMQRHRANPNPDNRPHPASSTRRAPCRTLVEPCQGPPGPNGDTA